MKNGGWVVVALVAACGNSEPSASSSPTAFTRESLRLQCEVHNRCCATAPQDVDQCVETLLAEPKLSANVEGYESALQTGAATWNQTAAERCLAQMRVSFASCTATLDRSYESLCSEALVGTVPPGGACGKVAFCQPGTACVPSTSKCAATAHLGESRAQNGLCDRDLYCDGRQLCSPEPTPPAVTVGDYFCTP